MDQTPRAEVKPTVIEGAFELWVQAVNGGQMIYAMTQEEFDALAASVGRARPESEIRAGLSALPELWHPHVHLPDAAFNAIVRYIGGGRAAKPASTAPAPLNDGRTD